MKKRLFTIVTCLLCIHLSAQDWVVSYVGEHLSGFTTLADGFVDTDGVTFLAGQEGPNETASNALLLRIEPDGVYSTFRYDKEGYQSKATCILEMNDHHLFVAGNMADDDDDYIMVLILDKHFNLLYERQYEKDVEAVSFRACKATLDCHNHVIVSSAIVRNNAYQGTELRGLFLKLNYQGEKVGQRYLIEEYPDPLYYFMDFRMRQMWYKGDSETLLCLSTGYGGVLSFVTFDSAFNYIEEHPVWRNEERYENTLFREDAYTDYWYNDEDALFFSSRGDYDDNKLRVSRVNTQGTFLDFICLNERTDTIDDAANARCMASANDSTFYFLFHYHTWPLYPGIGCVYQLNDRLEIIGRHLDDDHPCYQSRLVLPTADNGCIVVYDSCAYQPLPKTKHPVIKKLSPNDFEQVYMSVVTTSVPKGSSPFPNPADQVIHFPLGNHKNLPCRCRVTDALGRLITDRIVGPTDSILQMDISGLAPGVYQFLLYTSHRTLLSEKFIKK